MSSCLPLKSCYVVFPQRKKEYDAKGPKLTNGRAILLRALVFSLGNFVFLFKLFHQMDSIFSTNCLK